MSGTSSPAGRGEILIGVLPKLFILLFYVGASYSALDCTVGEKERGTMEPLLCVRARRAEIALGKLIAVLCCALAEGILLILPLGIAILSGFISLPPTFPPALGSALYTLFLLFLAAAFLSCLMFTIGLLARSQKEAQGYAQVLVIIAVLLWTFGSRYPATLGRIGIALPVLDTSFLSEQVPQSASSSINTFVLLFYNLLSTIAMGAIAIWAFTKEKFLLLS
jgi:ABC-type Na+ efflux pump permease subunit